MRNKYGQFYLMAAIVIIAVIVGFVSVKNYLLGREEPSQIIDLSTELALEGAKVIDFGIYQGSTAEERQKTMEKFATQYSSFIGKDKSLLFITGNLLDGLLAFEIKARDSGSITLGESEIKFEELQVSGIPLVVEGKTINVQFGGDVYKFDLAEGENFYFLISQEIGGEYYVTGTLIYENT